MTNSRSRASRSSLWRAAIVLCTITLATGVADAGRKRVVVLDFEGPKAEKFHDDLVRLIKKAHTVVPIDKWNGTAEELGAVGLSEKSLKKVAKKLKVDAIVEGKIEKRRDQFIIHLKLHEGKTGTPFGNPIDAKAEGPRLDGKAERELKDELTDALDSVGSNRPTGDDEAEDKPAAAGKKPGKKAEPAEPADDEAEDEPVRKKPGKKAEPAPADDDEDKPVRRGFSRRDDDERGGERTGKKPGKKPEAVAEDEDEAPAKKPGKKADEGDKLAGKKPGKKADAAAPVEEDEDKLPAKKPGKKADEGDKLAGKKPGKKAEPAAAAPVEEDEDKLPAKKPGKKADEGDKLAAKHPVDDEDKLPAKKPARAADDKPTARKVVADDDAKPARKKAVAARDDEDASAEADVARPHLDRGHALSPGERAVDAVVGLSVTLRRLAFTSRADLPASVRPPGYKGQPVPGAMIDATIYPAALGHDRADMLKNLGINVMYDRVLLIKSKDRLGVPYSTTESRYGFGAVFRYPFGTGATAPVAIGSLGYSSQSFTVSAGGAVLDFPSVKYSMIEPGVGFRLPIGDKLVAGIDARLMVLIGTGPIGDAGQYGSGSKLGYEGAASVDYMILGNLFARAAFRYETIGLKFNGSGAMTTSRDGDAETVDVTAARDTYLGGLLTVGYLY